MEEWECKYCKNCIPYIDCFVFTLVKIPSTAKVGKHIGQIP